MLARNRQASPLWSFSLAVYGRDGVAAECLELQRRHGLDINLLLFCAYLGAVEGVRIEGDDLADAADAVASWHVDVVRTLRAARRGLKPWGSADEGEFSRQAEELRNQVKAAELEAERIEQAMLWDWLRRWPGRVPVAEPQEALVANIRALLALSGAGPKADAAVAAARLYEAAQAVAAQGRARAAARP
jgi:uncharacterized protein (TIGR02444 family)